MREPVAREPGPAAVPLPDRADRDDHRPPGTEAAGQRVRSDDHADGAGAIVDEQTQPIGQISGRTDRGAFDEHAGALHGLGDRSGLLECRLRLPRSSEHHDVGEGNP